MLPSYDVVYNLQECDLPSVDRKSLDEEMKAWKFNGDKFKIGRKNFGVKPELIHPFWYALTKQNRLLGVDEWASYIDKAKIQFSTSSYDRREVIASRVYQTHVGSLREVHLASEIQKYVPKVIIHKNLNNDLNRNTDLVFKNDKRYVRVAIKHEGDGSDEHDARRKNSKDTGSIKLIAPNLGRNSGVHVIQDADVQMIVNKLVN